jgi:CSLREA domain-containing protein
MPRWLRPLLIPANTGNGSVSNRPVKETVRIKEYPMPSSPFLRARALVLLSIFTALIAFVSLWSNWERASAALYKSSIAPAATITVNSTADVANSTDGLCTLREAITAANTDTASGVVAGECGAGGGPDTIDLTGLSGTITLTDKLPNITSAMSFSGPGQTQLTISANNLPDTRVFGLFPLSPVAVNFSGLTIANGNANHDVGGAIYVQTTAAVTVTNCTLRNNLAVLGGAIGNSSSGSFDLINSTVRNNSAGTAGGIYSGAGTFNIINSTINNNTASGGSSNGGGIVEGSGTLNVINSTISANMAGGGNGGAIYHQSNTPINITNSTISNNSCTTLGGGINSNNGATVQIRNSIISGNLTTLANGRDLSGTFTSLGHNLISRSGGFSGITNGVNSDMVDVNPLLSPLANYGGTTQTLALKAGSPALDAGDNCVTQVAHCGDANIPQMDNDQRGPGFSRIIDGPDADTTDTVDMGAFEAQLFVESISTQTINEDGQLQISFHVSGVVPVTSVTATSDNLTLVPNNPTNISVSGSGSTWMLTINPASKQFGSAGIDVTASGSDGQSMTASFLLVVNPVNDQPSFTKGQDQTANEDTGFHFVSNWATNLSAGPANESGQTLTFQVTNNTNAALFSSGPSISSIGQLSYTTATNANGSATITIVLKDSGGTANGGVDTSASQTFTITITPLNDAPTFTKGGNQTVNNNGGPQTVNNWATNISPGPADESGQTVSFQVTANSNPSLFTVVPAISSTGTLTYQPATNAGGTATISLNLKDNGGTANGGQDTSGSQSFSITITPVGGFVSFNASNFNTTESSGFATITVRRTGDTSRAVTVDYATSGATGLPCATTTGAASSRCDFTSALGTLKFAAGDTTKPVTVLISQDSFVEGFETFTIALSNPGGGAALSTPATATVTIADDPNEPSTNAIDDASNFVRQNYHDFLNREPDASGLAFWTNQITSCGSDQACIELKRINVSAAFFLSIEFQGTGYLVERLYKTSYGDATGASTFDGAHQLPVPIVRFNEFLPDTQEIGQGVIVGQAGWETVLENNKQAFTLSFVQRARFVTAFPTSLTPAQFVEQLNTNAGNVLSFTERATAIGLFGSATDTSNPTARAQALRQVAEDPDLNSAESNRAFVLMQYFGYMRRNPNDPQDTDYSGYEFWLTKLNQFGGNFVNAEMVKAFITAAEYRQHFGQ